MAKGLEVVTNRGEVVAKQPWVVAQKRLFLSLFNTLDTLGRKTADNGPFYFVFLIAAGTIGSSRRRNGSRNLWAISGQNSRKISKPVSDATLIPMRCRDHSTTISWMIGIGQSYRGCGAGPLGKVETSSCRSHCGLSKCARAARSAITMLYLTLKDNLQSNTPDSWIHIIAFEGNRQAGPVQVPCSRNCSNSLLML